MLSKYLNDIVFDHIWVLLPLPLLLAWLWYVIRRNNTKTVAVKVSSLKAIPQVRSWKTSLRNTPYALRALALACILVALAAPAKYTNIEQTTGEGIEIAICLDVSGSMLAQDFTPDRLQASISLARDFVRTRQGDRIALIAFAGQSLSLAPLTTDLQVVDQQLRNITYGMLADGTSIGTGLASALNKLNGGNGRSRIAILLTDGEDNGGFIDPQTALDMAKNFGYKVYTIGIGKEGYAPMPYKNAAGVTVLEQEKVSIDEVLLKKIASETGGKYFRATNNDVLSSIYAEINTLEKSKIQVSVFRKREDKYFMWIAAALILLALEGIWRTTITRRLV